MRQSIEWPADRKYVSVPAFWKELEKAGKAVIMKLSSRSCSLKHIAMGQDPAERNAAYARLPGAMLETR